MRHWLCLPQNLQEKTPQSMSGNRSGARRFIQGRRKYPKALEITRGLAAFSASQISQGFVDLSVFQLNRCRTTEDRHSNFEARGFFVNFFNKTRERCKWTIDHTNLLANLE